MKKAATILLGLFYVTGTKPVRAEAWEFKTGVGPVYGTTFSTSDKDGIGFQAYGDLGLNELLSLTVGGGFAYQHVGKGNAYSLTNIGLGILYNIDVLVVVPFVSVRLGWLHRRLEEGAVSSGLGLSVSVGFDYLWTDYFTVGFAAEYHGLLSDMNSFPAYVAFIGRVGFRLPY